ncbi:MAG: phosphate ABC transporter substrate-binding protein [Gammaproteobacteria bacterium]|nr:phosphate ABC transporter substrate-binding protein [Gammaproteobacteria bacterium]
MSMLDRKTRNALGIGLLALSGLLGTSSTQAAEAELQWVGCGITKKAFMSELAAAYEKKTGIKIVLQGGGATKGIRDTALGKSDLGGACRVALENHKEEIQVTQIPVAWDALVVIANKNNPVENIGLHQLRQLYLGKLTNWKQLGGHEGKIELYVRKGKLSGVGRTLRELVFADYDQEFSKNARVVRSSGPLEKAVEDNLSAIGVTGVSSAKKRNVKILKLAGKEPSYDNIKSGEYLLYRPLYLVINRSTADKRIKDFVRYAQSREGKEVIRKAGVVPYTDAIGLVMKQVEQLRRANEAGL